MTISTGIPARILVLTAALWLVGGCPKANNKDRQGSQAKPRRIEGPVPAELAAQLPLVSGDAVLQDAPLVTISRESVAVDGGATNALQDGVIDANDKRDGPDGFFVDGLFKRLQAVARRLKKTKQRRCFLLAAAESIPYFTVASVLYTASQADFQCYQIAVIKPPESRAALTAINMGFPATAKPNVKGHLSTRQAVFYEDAWGRKFHTSRAGLLGSAVHLSAKSRNTLGSMFDRSAVVSSDAEDVLGVLIGHAAGDESGFSGLGLGGAGRGKGKGSGAGGVGFGGWGGFGKGGGDGAGGADPGGQGFGIGKYRKQGPRVFMSRASVSGGLDAATIRRVIRRHLSEVKYCYVSIGIPANPDLGGMVKVSFTVKPGGEVGQVSIAQSTLNHSGTEQCIKRAVQRWRFPKPEGSMPFVTYPFHFKPKG
ncbi:MAG: AgmX/PglI C-terminal domain-containing protein [bacterium]